MPLKTRCPPSPCGVLRTPRKTRCPQSTHLFPGPRKLCQQRRRQFVPGQLADGRSQPGGAHFISCGHGQILLLVALSATEPAEVELGAQGCSQPRLHSPCPPARCSGAYLCTASKPRGMRARLRACGEASPAPCPASSALCPRMAPAGTRLPSRPMPRYTAQIASAPARGCTAAPAGSTHPWTAPGPRHTCAQGEREGMNPCKRTPPRSAGGGRIAQPAGRASAQTPGRLTSDRPCAGCLP